MGFHEKISQQYDAWSAQETGDIEFYVGLALESEGLIVELAVGNGRVAVPVAQATGRRVIGIDSSSALLERARAKAAEAGGSDRCRWSRARDVARQLQRVRIQL